jgi:hypothetical protein
MMTVWLTGGGVGGGTNNINNSKKRGQLNRFSQEVES